MPNNDIKGLLDDIISGTEKSFKNDKKECCHEKPNHPMNPQTFDKGKFREKLSMYVLKDLVCSMMHNETKDLDGMIDNSIMRHIHDNYDGSCFGYLCNARDRLKSPLLDDVIQEVEDEVESRAEELENTKDPDIVDRPIDVKEMLKDVNGYTDLSKKIEELVTQKVIDDVAGVLTKKNPPKFDDIDKKLKKASMNDVAAQAAEEQEDTMDEMTSESKILKMTGEIVVEHALMNDPISTEDGFNQAVVEYCISKMDYLFKATPKISIYAKYNL